MKAQEDPDTLLFLGRDHSHHRHRRIRVHQFLRQSLLLLANRKTQKNFLKTSIALDTHKQVILCFKITQRPVHNVKHAEPLLRECRRTRRTACYVVDKGYYAERLHRQIREDIGADSMIPVRTWQGRVRSGVYRQEVSTNFDEERYRERNKVETTFSVHKRRFGEELKARKYWYQVKGIKSKLILHNLTKAGQAV